MDNRRDAIATIRSCIHGSIASTSASTGLRAGPESEALLDEIMKELTDPAFRWALAELGKEDGAR